MSTGKINSTVRNERSTTSVITIETPKMLLSGLMIAKLFYIIEIGAIILRTIHPPFSSAWFAVAHHF